MRNLISIMLVLCMMVSLLAACGDSDQTEAGKPAPETVGQTASAEGEMTPSEEETTAATEETAPAEGAKEEISLKDLDITLIAIGETMELYTGSVPVSEVTFATANANVATFENGVVTAMGKGETTIYAEHEGVRISCNVYCNIKENATKPTEPAKPTEPTETSKPTEPAETSKPTEPAETSKPTEPTEPTETTAPPQSSTNAGPRDPSLAAPANQAVSASFFDDAVFIGDSISLKLSQYAASSGALGKAKFLVVGSYGVNNAVNDHPDTKLTYQGVKYTNVEEALAATGAKKVFIMLGMNDIGLHGIDKTIKNWGVLLDLLYSTCPDITVYIQSMTPVWTGGEKGKLNNANVLKYNEQLKTFAANHGCKYIDIHPYMQDSTGGLATSFCSDSYVHLTNEGAKRWIAVLKAYTGY